MCSLQPSVRMAEVTSFAFLLTVSCHCLLGAAGHSDLPLLGTPLTVPGKLRKARLRQVN